MQDKPNAAAVLYAAKSTADTHGSIPTQLEDCRALAEREGWEIVGEFRDEGFSAYSGNRGPGLEDAKRAAAAAATERGEAVLVAQHSDRLARGAGDKPGAADSLVEVWHAMARLSVRLRSVQNDVMLSDPLLVAASSKLAHEESLRKSSAVKSGMKRRREAGKHHGGPAAYGYTYRDGDLVPVEAEAVIVRRIFGEYLAGASQLAISKNLTTDRIPTKSGGNWHQGTVRGILANPINAGMIPDGDDVVPGVHEAIIDMPKWRKVETMRKAGARTGSGRKSAGRHLFRKGMLRCGECGEAMVPRTSPNRASAPTEVYRCYGRHRDVTSCAMRPLPRAEIDVAVYRYFEQVGLDVEATRAAVAEATDRKVAEIKALRVGAEKEAQLADDRLARVRRHFQDGSITADDWADQRDQLTEERDAAQAEAERLRTSEQETADGGALVDVEAETLRRLAAIRSAMVGEITDAAGTDAVRASLSRLFEGFVVHLGTPDRTHVELIGKVWIEPLVREEAIEENGDTITPKLRREPLDQAADNEYVVLTR